MEHHSEKKNQMDRPHPKTQWIREEYNRRKIEENVPRGRRPRDKYMGQIRKRVHFKKYQEVTNKF
jgi:hypothetical protein